MTQVDIFFICVLFLTWFAISENADKVIESNTPQCWTKTMQHTKSTWHPIVCPFKGE